MYPSDMSDAQWQVLAKHFAEMNKRGHPRHCAPGACLHVCLPESAFA